jgi:hypothetical protein
LTGRRSNRKHMRIVKASLGVLLVLTVGAAHGGEFRTIDPLRAFINGEYPLGDDYFINGSADTYIFRCVLSKKTEKVEGIALSEISIWGNHGGPWEVFRRSEKGGYIYVGTKGITNTSCLEWCRSKEYLASGRCTWQRGWPKQ